MNAKSALGSHSIRVPVDLETEQRVAFDGTRKVPSIERAAHVLDLVATSREPLSFADLVRASGHARSSVHAVLATLVDLGLVSRGTDGRFLLGTKVLDWAGAYAIQSRLVTAFGDIAYQASELSDETVVLAQLEGTDVVYLACRQGTRPLSPSFRLGGRFPCAYSASGKAILSTVADDRAREIIELGGFRQFTRHSAHDYRQIASQLEFCRQEGYAMDEQETRLGVLSFASPVFGSRGKPAVAAVAVSALHASVSARQRLVLSSAVRNLAMHISQKLQGE